MTGRNRRILAITIGLAVLVGLGLLHWVCSDRLILWRNVHWGAGLHVRGHLAIQYPGLDMRGPTLPVYGRAMDLRKRKNLSCPSSKSWSAFVDADESWLLYSHGIEMGLMDATDLDLYEDLYAMDLCTSKIIPIRIGKVGNPRLGNNAIVWTEETGEQWCLYAYDLQKGEKFLIRPDATWRFIARDGMVIWVTGHDFHVYDLNRRMMILNQEVPELENYLPELHLSGHMLVWKSKYLFGLNLDSGQVRTICRSREIADYRINGDQIVWSDRRNGNWDIYGYDLKKDREFPVCIVPGDQKNPRVSGSRVIWSDSRNGNWDIYGFDLKTRTEFPICTDRGDQTLPAIDGNVVIWFDAGHKSWWMRWIRTQPGSVQAKILRW